MPSSFVSEQFELERRNSGWLCGKYFNSASMSIIWILAMRRLFRFLNSESKLGPRYGFRIKSCEAIVFICHLQSWWVLPRRASERPICLWELLCEIFFKLLHHKDIPHSGGGTAQNDDQQTQIILFGRGDDVVAGASVITGFETVDFRHF